MSDSIKELVTIHGVKVDSICSTMWQANKGGIKAITETTVGVRINWNFGSTFVPWSNVRYTVMEFAPNYVRD